MRYIVFCVFLLLSVPVNATENLGDCFKDIDDETQVSICVSRMYGEREAVRNIIESEFEEFILADKYLEPPQAPINPNKENSLSNAANNPKSSSTLPTTFDENRDPLERWKEHNQGKRIDKKISEMKQKSQEDRTKAKRMARFMKDKETYGQRLFEYEMKKREALKMLRESKLKFEEYREAECTRQSKAQKPVSKYAQEISSTSCYYDMATHRIKMLQRSMKK